MNIGILLTGVGIWQEGLSSMVLLLPLAYLPLILLGLRLDGFLASLGMYVRDMQHSMALMVQVLFFMSPIQFFIPNQPYRNASTSSCISILDHGFGWFSAHPAVATALILDAMGHGGASVDLPLQF
jgi:hypothetical protein